jgi:hypothetical protein
MITRTQKDSEVKHEEIEWLKDESGRHYYISDDLVPEVDGDDANKVVFANAVVPSKEEMAVKTKIPVKTHYDEFRGIYYIDAKDLKVSTNREPSSSTQGLFSVKSLDSDSNDKMCDIAVSASSVKYNKKE